MIHVIFINYIYGIFSHRYKIVPFLLQPINTFIFLAINVMVSRLTQDPQLRPSDILDDHYMIIPINISPQQMVSL